MGISKVGIVGAGTMGSGIAQVCAAAGFDVTLLDVSPEAVRKGVDTVSRNLDRLVAKEKLAAADKAAILERVSPTTSYTDFASSDLVIEATTKSEALKQRMFRDIDAIVAPATIVATNTSSISVTRLAAVTGRAPQFIGMHFFNPVPVMAVVELIRGLQTSDETLATVRRFVEALGRSAVVARNSPSFAVSRILCPMINEAIFALQEGLTSAEEIDSGMMLGCNQPIGPLALADLIGLDTMFSVMEAFYNGVRDPKYRPAPLLKEMVDAGFLGRKSGQGFFRYACPPEAFLKGVRG